MTYAKYLVDGFDGTSVDSTVWFVTGGAYITENGDGYLHITGDSSYPFVDTNHYHDLTTNMFAVKWFAGTGTPTSSSRFIIQATDSANNQLRLSPHPIDNTWDLAASGSATVSGTLSGTGLGTDLADGTWFGIGMLGSDNILRCYKSTDDGATWTQFASCTVGGTFTKTAVKLRIQAGHFTGTESPTWACKIGQCAIYQTPSQKAKARFGGAFVEASVKVRVGGAWVRATPKLRAGHTWTSSK